MGILKPLLKFGAFGLFVILAFTSPATAQDLSPITTMLQSIGAALTGPVGRALGLVAIASIGIIFLMGRMNFVYAASVIVGIVILLGAATILSGF